MFPKIDNIALKLHTEKWERSAVRGQRHQQDRHPPNSCPIAIVAADAAQNEKRGVKKLLGQCRQSAVGQSTPDNLGELPER
jgi:hypothetical protein